MAYSMIRLACSGQRFRPAATWQLLLAAILCIAAAHVALPQEVPIWANFTTENSDLPNNSVTALAPGADGALWVGTFGGGLALRDKSGEWRSYSKDGTHGGLPDDRVWALAPGADGALWVGTLGGGLAQFDKSGAWRSYSKDGTHGGLPDDRVMALAPGADGALWVGTLAAGWPGSIRAASGAPTARTAPMAGCRTTGSWRWRPARTARSGSEP